MNNEMKIRRNILKKISDGALQSLLSESCSVMNAKISVKKVPLGGTLKSKVPTIQLKIILGWNTLKLKVQMISLLVFSYFFSDENHAWLSFKCFNIMLVPMQCLARVA